MKTNFRNIVQKTGRYLSSMIMPNIGAFIAWGLITALFIADGWIPCEELASMTGPMLKYLLPILIAYTAGKNVAGDRAGVVAAVAVVGVIQGSDIPMFLGAMLMGPIAGLCIKYFDRLTEGKVKSGFEMLTKNFSAGIIGMILAIIGFFLVGHAVEWLTNCISIAAKGIVNLKLLPLISLVVEPGKVLFLNNAINHGIFSPIGIEQVSQFGDSIFFLIESNPGAGLGVLLACCIAGRGTMKKTAPGAAIIHFLGGIHEIYFPYILAKPSLIIATIAGSACGLLFFLLTGAGLVAPASPGSIISILAMTPSGKIWAVAGGVAISAAVSFAVSYLILKLSKEKEFAQTVDTLNEEKTTNVSQELNKSIKKIVFACDAGMGSSALGATNFRKHIKKEGLDIEITNCAADSIPIDTDIVVCQKVIASRLQNNKNIPEIIVIENFLSDPALDMLFNRLCNVKPKLPLISKENILLGLKSESKEEAISRAGNLLYTSGYTDMHYISAMIEREKLSTTYMGLGIAIPHGTSDAKQNVKHSGIVFLQYPESVDFDEEKAELVIGIAGVGDEHLEILARLSEILEDEEKLNILKSSTDKSEILNLLTNND